MLTPLPDLDKFVRELERQSPPDTQLVCQALLKLLPHLVAVIRSGNGDIEVLVHNHRVTYIKPGFGYKE